MTKDDVPKKQVSFRLDENLLEALEFLRGKYSRLSTTDLVDLILKEFISSIDLSSEHWQDHLDQAIGRYFRGECDLAVELFREFAIKRESRKNKR